MKRIREEPRGPWKAKRVEQPKGILVMVCARCRRQGTMVKCGTLYGCTDCVRNVGGPEAFLLVLKQSPTPRSELEDAMAQVGA